MNQPLLWFTALVATAVTWPVTIYAQTTVPSRAPSVTKAKPEAQRIFATPEKAASALADALRSDDVKQIHSVLGPGSGKVIRSGDPVQDASGRKSFLHAYKTSVKIEPSGYARVTLLIRSDGVPLSIPPGETGAGWQLQSPARC